MKPTKPKRRFRDELALILRGYKTLTKALGKAPYILTAAATVFGTGATYLTVYFGAQIVNELAAGAPWQRMLTLVLLTLGVDLLAGVLKTALQKAANARRAESWQRIQFLFSEKALSFDFTDAESAAVKDLYAGIDASQNWAGWGLQRLDEIYNRWVTSVVRIVCSVSLTVSLFTSKVAAEELRFLDHPLFLLLVVAALLVSTCGIPRLFNRAERMNNDLLAGNMEFYNKSAGYWGWTIALDHARSKDVRMYRQETVSIPREREVMHHFVDVMQRSGAANVLIGIGIALTQLFSGAVYLFVALKALGGAFGVGSIAQYVAAIAGVTDGLRELMQTYGEMKINNPYLEKIFTYLDWPNLMQQGTLPVEKRMLCDGGDNEYEIEFCDVSFRYPSTDAWALRHVSLKFRIGERLAIVGMNGSGKTTFIKLLCRLYDPTEGEILLNGIDIRKYDYAEYMSVFAVVFQDFHLLSFSLAQNVAAGVEFDEERVRRCLTEAGFGERLARMTQGVNTCLYKDFDKEGVEISGGEAQKVALARALYKSAPFIVLDEPTAALDPIAEYEVYTKFNDIVGDKTAIYISHRLASCRFCDDIAVFHEGALVQRGSHEELVADEGGKYYELWHAQAQYYTA